MAHLQPHEQDASGFSRYVRIDPATWSTVKEQSRARFAGLKPLSDFFDRNRFSRPSSISGKCPKLYLQCLRPLTDRPSVFTQRLNYNLTYFQNNYIVLALLITVYLLVTNIWFLFTIMFLLGGFKFITALPSHQPTSLPGGFRVTPRQLWPIFVGVGLIMVYFTSSITTFIWMASCSALVIASHAGMMEPPIEANFASAEQQV
ncbi:PRA1 family protein-domain-containing protein [Phlyctochytrium arcticum]|nr:PRA1 family protein-domain-containing protein [Phlyctochytrium arcticum]